MMLDNKDYDRVIKGFQAAYFKIYECFNYYCKDLIQEIFFAFGRNPLDSEGIVVHCLTKDRFQTKHFTPEEIISGLNLTNLKAEEFVGIDSLIRHFEMDLYESNKFLFHEVDLGISDVKAYIVCKLHKLIYNAIPKTRNSLLDIKFKSFPEYLFYIIQNRLLVDILSPLGHNSNSYLLTEREILEHAASWFIVIWISDCVGQRCKGLYSFIDHLSRLMYETKHNLGRIVFTKEPIYQVSIIDPFPITNFKKTRKLLEMTNRFSALISDGKNIIGFSEFNINTPSDYPGIVVEYYDSQKWKLIGPSEKGFQTIFDIAYGYPRFTDIPFDEINFISTLASRFPDLPESAKASLIIIFSNIRSVKNGAVVIFDRYSKEESDRLRSRGIRIQPIEPDITVLKSMCNVDGAIMVDLDGKCHSFGVILDGITTEYSSDSSRGSRFNSTAAYINGRSGLAIGCVFSVDGYVDIFPKS